MDASRRFRSTRSLQLERLETRLPLTRSLLGPTIEGVVSIDRNANEQFDPGEQVANVDLLLFLDDGDGQFDLERDQQLEQQATASDGSYCFQIPTISGNYFIVQPEQSLSDRTIPQRVSPLLSPGSAHTVIDQFFGEQSVATGSSSASETDSTLTDSALGGERDLALFSETDATLSVDAIGEDRLELSWSSVAQLISCVRRVGRSR